MAHSVWINELTWEDIENYLKRENIALIPIGSTEQHGPAGPLGVDTYAAIAIAGDAAKQAGVLTVPPMWFGDSPHHLDFPGTISLRPETLIAVVKDIVHSLAHNGFKNSSSLTATRTNLPALTLACRELLQYELPDIRIALTDPLFLCTNAKEIKEAAEHHAGELEISHVWYKYPDLIKKDKLPAEAVNLSQTFSSYIKPDLSRPGVGRQMFWSSPRAAQFRRPALFQTRISPRRKEASFIKRNMSRTLSPFIASSGSSNAKTGQ
jgi:creatinine amidohydrolase